MLTEILVAFLVAGDIDEITHHIVDSSEQGRVEDRGGHVSVGAMAIVLVTEEVFQHKLLDRACSPSFELASCDMERKMVQSLREVQLYKFAGPATGVWFVSGR
jgi:hypothetical protein